MRALCAIALVALSAAGAAAQETGVGRPAYLPTPGEVARIERLEGQVSDLSARLARLEAALERPAAAPVSATRPAAPSRTAGPRWVTKIVHAHVPIVAGGVTTSSPERLCVDTRLAEADTRFEHYLSADEYQFTLDGQPATAEQIVTARHTGVIKVTVSPERADFTTGSLDDYMAWYGPALKAAQDKWPPPHPTTGVRSPYGTADGAPPLKPGERVIARIKPGDPQVNPEDVQCPPAGRRRD